jgi:hypothetical protein
LKAFLLPFGAPGELPRASGNGRSASLALGTVDRSGFALGISTPGAYAIAWGCSSDFGRSPPWGLHGGIVGGEQLSGDHSFKLIFRSDAN